VYVAGLGWRRGTSSSRNLRHRTPAACEPPITPLGSRLESRNRADLTEPGRPRAAMEATDIARATEPSRRRQWAPRSDPTTCAWAVCGPSQLGLPRFLTAKQGKTQNSVFPGQMGVWRLDRADQWLKKILADRSRPTNRHHLSPRLAAFRGRVAYLGGRGPRRGDRNCPRRLAVDWDGRRSKRASAVWLSSPSAHAPQSSAGTAPAMGRGMGRDRFGLHPRGREGGRRSGPDQSVSSGGLQAHIAAGVVPRTTASSTMSLRTLQLCRWPWILATGRRQLASREQQ
jgi:hypothetical protein